MSAHLSSVPQPWNVAYRRPLTTELEVVERELSDTLECEVAALAAVPMADIRVQVRAENLGDAFPASDGAGGALAADIAMLSRAYAACMDAPMLDVRLERIAEDGCRAFHRDNVSTRLLVTYFGPGTQYVGDADGQAALQKQRRFAGAIHSIPTGAVAWLRGSRAGPDCGLVHRSPRIAGQGVTRLLLAINAAAPATAELWKGEAGPVLASLQVLRDLSFHLDRR